MPVLTVALVVALLAGCGGSQTERRAPGGPSEPPPTVAGEGPDPPPPAWVETESGDHWLGYGSYCWDDGCVDYIEPWRREEVPEIALRRGEIVRFHLPFDPRELVIEVFEQQGGDPRSVRLEPKRVFDWTFKRDGYVSVAASRKHGDASYLARFTFR